MAQKAKARAETLHSIPRFLNFVSPRLSLRLYDIYKKSKVRREVVESSAMAHPDLVSCLTVLGVDPFWTIKGLDDGPSMMTCVPK